MCALKVLHEGSVSQNFDLGPSFDWEKRGNFLTFFDIQISTFYKIKSRT